MPDAAEDAEDAGEALGVGEVGEHTAETLDLLLCLSKMMTARRHLVWDKEFICLAAGMLRNSYVRLQTGQCMLLSAKVYLIYPRMGPQKDPLYSIDKLFIRMDSWWMSKKQVSKCIVTL